MEFHHISVLLNECLEGLNINPNGTYLDCTLGGAGHTSEIYKRLNENGTSIGIDRDGNAIEAATARMAGIDGPARFVALRGNFHDAKALLANGADGLVFGFLHEDGTVDEARTRTFVELAEGKPCVFHRAIDVVPDWKRALDSLIRIGVTRVLTSGQESDVFFALDTIAEMIRFAGNAIEILPGAGITLRNVDRVVAETGCTQVHLARHKAYPETSVANNRSIYYGGALYPPEDRFEITDGDYVAAVRAKL